VGLFGADEKHRTRNGHNGCKRRAALSVFVAVGQKQHWLNEMSFGFSFGHWKPNGYRGKGEPEIHFPLLRLPHHHRRDVANDRAHARCANYESMRRALMLMVIAVVVIALLVYRSRNSKARLNVEPHVREEIEKAKRR
jgi:hypothetical protein